MIVAHAVVTPVVAALRVAVARAVAALAVVGGVVSQSPRRIAAALSLAPFVGQRAAPSPSPSPWPFEKTVAVAERYLTWAICNQKYALDGKVCLKVTAAVEPVVHAQTERMLLEAYFEDLKGYDHSADLKIMALNEKHQQTPPKHSA